MAVGLVLSLQDRQKVDPALNIFKDKVRDGLLALKTAVVSESHPALELYLEIGSKIQSALLGDNTSVLDRIYNICYAHTYYQLWHSWLTSERNPYPTSMKKSFMPSSLFRDTIELAFNGLILLVLIMAEHYPEFAMIVGACSTTSIEQTFAMARSLIGDCKSSNTFWEFLWKFRSTAVKTTCLDAVKKACNQGPATENFPENYYPSKIPYLREKIK